MIVCALGDSLFNIIENILTTIISPNYFYQGLTLLYFIKFRWENERGLKIHIYRQMIGTATFFLMTYIRHANPAIFARQCRELNADLIWRWICNMNCIKNVQFSDLPNCLSGDIFTFFKSWKETASIHTINTRSARKIFSTSSTPTMSLPFWHTKDSLASSWAKIHSVPL